jgi:hypothetical protein
VTVPVRAAPVFAAAVIVTVPLPTPVAPALIDSQDVLVDAVHAHPSAAVTETGAVTPPAAATDSDVALTVYEHDAAASVTVTD